MYNFHSFQNKIKASMCIYTNSATKRDLHLDKTLMCCKAESLYSFHNTTKTLTCLNIIFVTQRMYIFHKCRDDNFKTRIIVLSLHMKITVRYRLQCVNTWKKVYFFTMRIRLQCVNTSSSQHRESICEGYYEFTVGLSL